MYAAKTGGDVTREPSLPMWLGLKLEQTIAELFTARTGKRVRRSNVQHKHPVWPYIRAHIDYRVIGEPAVLELKTSRSTDGWGEDQGSEIPVAYWIQVQHQLMVLGLPYAYVAALFGHYDFRTYTVERDFDFTEKLSTALVEFWENHVAVGIPPALDGSSAAAAILRRRYPTDTEPAIPATPEQSALVDELIAVRAEKKLVEDRDAILVNRIKDAIGAHSGWAGLVSWKQSKTKREVDYKKVVERLQPLVPEGEYDSALFDNTEEKEGARPFIVLKKENVSDGEAAAE